MTHLQTLEAARDEAERLYDCEVERIGEPFQQPDPFGSTLYPLHVAVEEALAAVKAEVDLIAAWEAAWRAAVTAEEAVDAVGAAREAGAWEASKAADAANAAGEAAEAAWEAWQAARAS